MMLRVPYVFRQRTAPAAVFLLAVALLIAAAGLARRTGDSVPSAHAAEDPPAPQRTGVAGKIVFEGKPLPGAQVYVFRDADGSFKGKGIASSAPVGADGVFSIPLSPENYYLVAKMGRPSANGAGPPVTVDAEGCHCPMSPSPDAVDPPSGGFFGSFEANPVTVQEGQVAAGIVIVVKKTE